MEERRNSTATQLVTPRRLDQRSKMDEDWRAVNSIAEKTQMQESGRKELKQMTNEKGK